MMSRTDADTVRPPAIKALGFAVGLSVLFFIVYLACNAVTAHRSDVGQAYFGWELWIPLVPVMILPYMSIDVLFFLAPFICAGGRELSTHGKRVALAIASAGLCFLIFPLTAGFARAPVDGIFGPVFDFLRGFDRPYNLAPSLHIALWVLIWSVFARHTRGLPRAALGAWFALIAVSTLLTHQHHVIDLATGYLLGLMCLHVLPDVPRPAVKHGRLALRYALGALAFLGVGFALRPWGLVLLWGVFALAALAAAYAGVGAAVFNKRDGLIPWPTRLLLLPYYAGAWVSFAWFTRSAPAWVDVSPGLLIGRKLNARQAQELVATGVTAVLDLTAEFAEAEPFRRLAYLNVPVLDLTAPSRQQVEEAVRFVEAHRDSGKVYVHCALGYGRSAAVVAAVLLKGDPACSAAAACDQVARLRRGAVVTAEIVAVLSDYRAACEGECGAVL